MTNLKKKTTKDDDDDLLRSWSRKYGEHINIPVSTKSPIAAANLTVRLKGDMPGTWVYKFICRFKWKTVDV